MQKTMGSVLLVAVMLLAVLGVAQGAERGKIEWLTLEEALEKAKSEPRPIFMDMYTDWCGWCKRMDVYTFSNPTIVDYISKNFYAVKFNAEMKKSVTYKGKEYAPHQGEGNGSHSLALTLTGGRLSFPTIIYFNAQGDVLSVVPGYLPPRELEPILHFIAEEAYNTVSWQDFQKGFKGSL